MWFLRDILIYMENTTQQSNSSSTLFIGIILGILILGGIFLYMREDGVSEKPTTPVQDSIEADITIPIRNDGEQSQ